MNMRKIFYLTLIIVPKFVHIDQPDLFFSGVSRSKRDTAVSTLFVRSLHDKGKNVCSQSGVSDSSVTSSIHRESSEKEKVGKSRIAKIVLAREKFLFLASSFIYFKRTSTSLLHHGEVTGFESKQIIFLVFFVFFSIFLSDHHHCC
jgi:hypothetical protein